MDNFWSRRAFLQAAATAPLLLCRTSSYSQTGSEEVLPGLRLLRSSVNTAILERDGRKLLIDSGELVSTPGGGAAEWALFTHHHRDQASAVYLRPAVS